MQKKTIRIIAVILAIILAGSILAGALASVAGAVSQSEIDALKTKKESIEHDSQEIEAKIDSLEYEQMDALEKKQVLDEQMTITYDLITAIDEQIEVYNGLIADKEKQVVAAQKKEDEQYELYKNRIRAMEENGAISYFEIIFGATSFSDLLSRIDLIAEIMSYDEHVYDDYVKAKEATIAAKEALQEANDLQKQAKIEQEEKQAELQVQIDAAEALIAELESNINEYQSLFDELQTEESKIQDEIDKMVEALNQQQAANTPSGGSSGVEGDGVAYGDFIWPSPSSRYITSLYGTRYHPVYHRYSTHNGVDIGASYGTNILAADGGVVTTATYSSSYGNYVVINHGNGTTTLYAHMSKLLVSKGQNVSQGQVIGLVGATGVVTGPHLHFEVNVNGSRVDPLRYFSNYTISPNA